MCTQDEREDLMYSFPKKNLNFSMKQRLTWDGSQPVQIGVMEANIQLCDSSLMCQVPNLCVFSKEIKEGICCAGHLHVTYGGELLYLWIFL